MPELADTRGVVVADDSRLTRRMLAALGRQGRPAARVAAAHPGAERVTDPRGLALTSPLHLIYRKG
jgi:hypothetical protein